MIFVVRCINGLNGLGCILILLISLILSIVIIICFVCHKNNSNLIKFYDTPYGGAAAFQAAGNMLEMHLGEFTRKTLVLNLLKGLFSV